MNTATILALEVTVATDGWRKAVAAPEDVAARAARAAYSAGSLDLGRPSDAPLFLGDVFIALETATAEAVSESKTTTDHLSHLVVHGMLHLLGHDHETDDEANIMERLESDVLAQLGVPDPYVLANEAAAP